MRLWHKDLIEVLPRKQLVAQWRECCAICSNIANKGTSNHLLVNKIINYSKIEFHSYTMNVIEEMKCRNIKVSDRALNNFNDNYLRIPDFISYTGGLFTDWHNERYLKQCLFNLQEKYDCGGITEDEWCRIAERFSEYL